MTAGPERSLEHLIQKSGLSGWVYVVEGREDGGQFLGGKEQK